ncbi:MAG: DUF721 domain-containing protein [Elstera sp.]
MVRRPQTLPQQIAPSPAGVEGAKPQTRAWKAGPRALSVDLAKVARPAARKFGFADARIFADWPTIMGEAIARMTLPLAVKRDKTGDRRTLVLKCSAAAAPLIQHYTQQILERVNTHYGFSAVTHLQMKQGPIPAPPVPPKPRPPLSAEAEAALQVRVSEVETEPLRAALIALGRCIGNR